MRFTHQNFYADIKKGFFFYFFYALLLCFAVNLRVDFSLHDLNGGIGEPALRNFDPGLRVTMFYITLALVVFLVFFFARIREKTYTWLTDYRLSVLNFSSLGALFVLYSYIQDPGLFPTLKKIQTLSDLFFSFPSVTFFILFHLGIFMLIPFSGKLKQLSSFITRSFPALPLPAFFYKLTPFILIPISLLIIHYQPLCRDLHNLFELGNPALSIQQFYEFGKIPVLETFNSHLLSEILPGFVYTWFHGYKGDLSFLSYDFFVPAAAFVIGFFIIFLLTENVWLSGFLFVFSPVGSFMFPNTFSMAPLPVLIFILSIKKNNTLLYYLWLMALAFNFFWRADIGVASFISSVCVAVFYHYGNWKDFMKSMLKPFCFILAFFLLLFLLISLFKNINPIEPVRNILLHFSGATIYGTKALSIEYDALFFTHYLIFPVLVIIGIGWLLINRKTFLDTNDPQSVKIILWLYFSVYYLVNFHRGLIRHTFAEQDDLHVSTFIFLILPSFLFLIQPQSEHKLKWLFFFLLSATLLSFQFKHPVEKNNNIKIPYDLFINRITGKTTIPEEILHKNNKNTVPLTYLDKHYEQIKLFSHFFLKKDETFLDFSNSPMLYVYCHRKNPSFFNQVPNHLSSKNLQRIYLEGLRKEKIPMVVFSRTHESGYDAQDEVPNPVRATLIANYIYRNYFPALILNDYSIWINKNYRERLKNLESLVNSFPADTIMEKRLHYDLKWIPYSLGKLDLDFIDRKFTPEINLIPPAELLETNVNYECTIPITDDSLKSNFLWLTIRNTSGEDAGVIISYGNRNDSLKSINSGELKFIVPPEKDYHQFIIPLSSQYRWVIGKNDYIRIIVLRGKINVIRTTLCYWK